MSTVTIYFFDLYWKNDSVVFIDYTRSLVKACKVIRRIFFELNLCICVTIWKFIIGYLKNPVIDIEHNYRFYLDH